MIKFRNKNNNFKKVVSDFNYLKLEIRNIKKQINLLSVNVYPTDLEFEEMLIR